MFGVGSIGGGEVLLILGLVLLLFGPRKIPEFGRTLGRTLAQFRQATRDFKQGLEREVELDKVRDTTSELRAMPSELRSAATSAGRPAPPSGPRTGPESPQAPSLDGPDAPDGRTETD